jgi:hypothetical protein
MFKLVEDPQWTGVTLSATTSCQIIPDVKHTHGRENRRQTRRRIGSAALYFSYLAGLFRRDGYPGDSLIVNPC